MAVYIIVNTLSLCDEFYGLYIQSQPSVNGGYRFKHNQLNKLKGRVSLLRDGLCCLTSFATQKKK